MRSRTHLNLKRAGTLPRLRWKPIGTGNRLHVAWTPQHEAYLGLACDGTLAELWNIPESSVAYRRRRLSLPAFCGIGQPLYWTKAMLRDLERLSNRQLARKYRISVITVAHKRRDRKVAPAKRWNIVHWTKAMLGALGTRSDKAIATAYNLLPATVSAKRKTVGIPAFIRTKLDWQSATVFRKLGTLHDNALAKLLEVDSETVRTRRIAAGIAPYRAYAWTAELVARLGTVPDRVIVKETGATPSTVSYQRKKRGIEKYSTHAKKRARRQ